jgi:polyvinyl alcohol dehydrogenase (cytochrome)
LRQRLSVLGGRLPTSPDRWEFDTAGDQNTVNGVAARGGAMEGPGPTIVGGTLYVTSSYGQWGGLSGNVLLAFSLKDD